MPATEPFLRVFSSGKLGRNLRKFDPRLVFSLSETIRTAVDLRDLMLRNAKPSAHLRDAKLQNLKASSHSRDLMLHKPKPSTHLRDLMLPKAKLSRIYGM